MIFDHLSNARWYWDAHPGLRAGFEFLQNQRLEQLADGRHEIDGDRLFVIMGHNIGRGREASPLEAHDRYIDIQYVVSGQDEFGVLSRAACKVVFGPMDEERDIVFFGDHPENWISVRAGMFVVFFPQDAHAPLAGEGALHKAVVKVAVHGW